MAYLRLRPHEYEIFSRLCRSLDLTRYPLHTFKRRLLAALADTYPALGNLLARLPRDRVQLLYDHLRRQPPADRPHGLTAEEVAAVAGAGMVLLSQARFARLLKRTLASRFREECPDLATKLERLSLRQFEGLCEQVHGRAGEGQ